MVRPGLIGISSNSSFVVPGIFTVIDRMSELFKELWAELDSQASAETDLVQMIRAASENNKQGAWTCYLVTVWTHKA